MPLSGVNHVGQLYKCAIPKLKSMVARLRGVLGSSRNEYPAIIRLYRTEPDRNIEVDVENLPLLPLVINVVESHNLLVKFEEVDFVGHYCFYFLLVLPVYHADTRLREVVRHSQLGIAVEANVLLIVAGFCVLGELAGDSRFQGQGVSAASGGVELVVLIVLVGKHLLEK